MPRKTEDVHSNATPHSDGKYESVINDPTATESPQTGVFIDNEAREQNPFQLSKTKNKDMEEFEKLLRGDALDKS
ncbi:hypothetical protein QNH23_10985 [Siminovitchia fortis]|uniref:Uncharacterized protein n=1 Tax=Siminovitchia fortis TaxID=254758 RepID=A0A451GCA5_9BACI|nr:hypothetical protein [Siminovitchia fortis]RWR12870.1 hypothetical protein D4N35_005680 [Siminovitchia fortis]WHY80472.1 hypothetical protein QNH23_10985 [Siminovitchia fortis]